MVDEPALKQVNAAWMEYIEGLRQPVGLQNVTMVEILESRHITQVLDGISRIYGRMKSLGVPILRLHSDRGEDLHVTGLPKMVQTSWTLSNHDQRG